MVVATHNPVLTDLFTEFVPVLQRGLSDLVELLDLRAGDPNHGDDGHAALVEAVARGDAEAAGRRLREELQRTLLERALMARAGAGAGAGCWASGRRTPAAYRDGSSGSAGQGACRHPPARLGVRWSGG